MSLTAAPIAYPLPIRMFSRRFSLSMALDDVWPALDSPRAFRLYARIHIAPLSRLGAMPSRHEIINNGHEAFLRAVSCQYPGGFSQLSEDLGLVNNQKWHVSNFLSLLRMKGSSGRRLVIRLAERLEPVIVELEVDSSRSGLLKCMNIPPPLIHLVRLPANTGCLADLLDRLGEHQGRVVDLMHDIELIG